MDLFALFFDCMIMILLGGFAYAVTYRHPLFLSYYLMLAVSPGQYPQSGLGNIKEAKRRLGIG